MYESTLQTFISLPVVNRDVILKNLLEDADRRSDAILWIANIETRTIIHLNYKFESWIGYSVNEVVSGGTEFLFNILDEGCKPEIIARQAFYTAFSRQDNFDPKNLLIQEMPYVFRTRSGNRISLHLAGSMLTYTGSQEPEIFVALWTKQECASIGQCLEHLVKIKLRHNEVYTHIPFQQEISVLSPVYATKNRNNHFLSRREQEVIKLLSQGYSTKEIAGELHISFNTIETHRKHLLQKFEAKNVAELIKKASKIFWLE